jgi:tetratricopeptide (TPR) repeat protein
VIPYDKYRPVTATFNPSKGEVDQMQFEDIHSRCLPILRSGSPAAISTVEQILRTALAEEELASRDRGLSMSFLGEIVTAGCRYREGQELYAEALAMVDHPEDRLRVLVPAAETALDLADRHSGESLRTALIVLLGASGDVDNAPWGWAILARLEVAFGSQEAALTYSQRGIEAAKRQGKAIIEAELAMGETQLALGLAEAALDVLSDTAARATGDCLIRALILMAQAQALLGRNAEVSTSLRYATEQVDASHLRTAERLLDAILIVGERDAQEGIKLARRVREHLRVLRRKGGKF